MKTTLLLLLFIISHIIPLPAQTDNNRYIEVTGTSEIEIVPDEIHYIIEIKEYFTEEFDGKSKPENFHTKVPLAQIEQNLRTTLLHLGISENAIRTQEAGDYWRERGHSFLIAKKFDITLKNFEQIDDIIKTIDTKGIHSMHIGELKNKDISYYHQQGKIQALKAAQKKAAYLLKAIGKKTGEVIRIVEPQESMNRYTLFSPSNVQIPIANSFDTFRTIKLNYALLVRFEITE